MLYAGECPAAGGALPRDRVSTMSKRAILYARVSTDEQADRGYSLPSQLEADRAYAARIGFSVVEELTEDCSGVIPIAERPKGKRLMERVQRREADALIAHQVDRYSRDIVDLLASVRGWLRAGVEVHVCDVGKIESELDIVLVIKGWQGSDERKKIIERTSRGRKSKASLGRVVGQGFAPYGYCFERATANGSGRPVVVGFVIVDEEARVVRLIFTWYVCGENGKPVGTHEICRRLQKLGIPVPSKNHFGSDRQSVWNPTIIYKILKNETYAGIWRWGKNIGAGGRGGQRPIEEQIGINVPPIVERQLWDAAQAKLSYNRQVSKRRATHLYLLRGRIRCGCGRRMVGQYVSTNKMPDPRYYRCPTTGQTWRERVCEQKMVRASEVEDATWCYLLGLMQAGNFEKRIRDAQTAKLRALEPKREALVSVEALLADCEREAAEVARAVRQVKEGIVKQQLDKQVEEVSNRYNALVQRRDALQAELNAAALSEQSVEAALQFREDIIAGMNDPTPENKQQVFAILGVEVMLRVKTIWVTCHVESNPQAVRLTRQSS